LDAGIQPNPFAILFLSWKIISDATRIVECREL
jgi:hypothetical protein